TMLLGLKHVDLASSKQYQNKTRQKLSRLQKCAFDLLGVGLDIENYCTLRMFFGLTTLAGLSRRNVRCGL
ncbi:hypothetical protein ACS6Q6_11240, partial [Enterobacter hormaechei subsp. hormaechei]|uniref:hypothetical protein n=1 Tax=Enterobacter hormaechei TaxID=158836 RepID=UPI003F423D0B